MVTLISNKILKLSHKGEATGNTYFEQLFLHRAKIVAHITINNTDRYGQKTMKYLNIGLVDHKK